MIVKPIHTVALPDHFIALDRPSGIGRKAHELELLMVKLAQAGTAVDRALASMDHADDRTPPRDERVCERVKLPRGFAALAAYVDTASRLLNYRRQRSRRIGNFAELLKPPSDQG